MHVRPVAALDALAAASSSSRDPESRPKSPAKSFALSIEFCSATNHLISSARRAKVVSHHNAVKNSRGLINVRIIIDSNNTDTYIWA